MKYFTHCYVASAFFVNVLVMDLETLFESDLEQRKSFQKELQNLEIYSFLYSPFNLSKVWTGWFLR